MAAFLPFLQEILPMLLPGSVHIAKAADIQGPPETPLEDEEDSEEEEEDHHDNDNDNDDGRDGSAGGGRGTGEENKKRRSPINSRDGDVEEEVHGEARVAEDRAGAPANGSTGERESVGEDGQTGGQIEDRKNATSAGAAEDAMPVDAHPAAPDRPRDTNDQGGDGDGYDNAKNGDENENKSETGQGKGAELPQQPRPPVAEAKRKTRQPRTQPAGGVTMRDAIVHKTDRMCASLLTVKPGCSTIVFHNGEQETIIYAVSGTAILATLPEDDHYEDNDNDGSSSLKSVAPPPTRHVLAPGDFAFVPAWTEHQVLNESTDTDVVWAVVHSGSEPTVVPLTEWGGPEVRF